MKETITRDPTDEEVEQAREVAQAMTEGLATAPSIGIGLGAIGMLTTHAFLNAVKAEYVLSAFDKWSSEIRDQIAKGVRNAHH